MRSGIGAALALALTATGAAAETYDACLAKVETAPEAAQKAAASWFAETGSPAARHCEAAALSALGAHKAAAEALRELANRADLGAEDRAALFLQAGREWRAAGLAAQAETALTAGLELAPRSAPLLIERAALRAAADRVLQARSDLSIALAAEPGNAEALSLRAAAHRRLGDAKSARKDAEQAVRIAPEAALGWLELGRAEAALGRKDEARRALLRAVEAEPGGAAAGLAQGALQDLDG